MAYRSAALGWLAWTTTITTMTLLLSSSSSHALVGPARPVFRPLQSMAVTASVSDETVPSNMSKEEDERLTLTHKIISNLRFRELKRQLEERELPDDGTTSQLRRRLRTAVFPGDECFVLDDGNEECGPSARVSFFVARVCVHAQLGVFIQLDIPELTFSMLH